MPVNERKLLEDCITAQIITVGHTRRAGQYFPFFRNTCSDPRLRLYLHAISDFNVANKARLTAYAAMRANPGTARNTG